MRTTAWPTALLGILLAVSPGMGKASETTCLRLLGMYHPGQEKLMMSLVKGPVPSCSPQPQSSGKCRAELLDEHDDVLSVQAFEPEALEIQFMHASGAETPAATDSEPEDEWMNFELELPWHEAARELRIFCGDRLVHRQARSLHAPDADFEQLDDGTVLTGTKEIRWRAGDQDGDKVSSFLEIVFDDDRRSLPLLVPFGSTRYALDSARLPSGTASLVLSVNDGFDTRWVRRQVMLKNSLRVQHVFPIRGEGDASLVAPVEVVFVTAPDPSSLSDDTFELFRGEEKIAGEVRLDFPKDFPIQASLRPEAPLQPRTRYRVRLDPKLQDIHGNRLAAPYEWEFVTEVDSIPPRVEATAPELTHDHAMTQRLLQAVFSEAVQWNDDTEAFVLTDADGQAVAGKVSAATRFQANDSMIFVPAAPLVPGTDYTARLSGAIADTAGNRMEDDHVWSFTAAERPVATDFEIRAHIDPDPVDADANGRFEKLDVAVDVVVLRPGSYVLSGELADSDGTFIDRSMTTGVLSQGLGTLHLIFDGKAILASGKDGPFVTTSLVLHRADDPGARVEYDKSSPYVYEVRAQDFEAGTVR
jgi:hypothetical protein